MSHKTRPQQYHVRTASLLLIMTSADFGRGFRDGRAGAPWPKGLDIPWNYERGRQLAALHPDLTLKRGRKITYEAKMLASIAVVEKAII